MPEIDIHGKLVTTPENFEDSALPTKYFSHSQYGMYKRCPRQFEYRYVKGLRQPPGIAMTQGSAIHVGAEKTHQHTIKHGKPLTLQEAESHVADTFERMGEYIEDWGNAKQGNVKDLTLHHFRVYYTQAVPVVRPKAVEESFAVKIGDVPIVGFIDLIDEVLMEDAFSTSLKGIPETYSEVVTDLKFTGRKWPPAKLTKDTQLTLYAHVKGIPRVRIDFLLDQKSGTRYVQERSIRTPLDAKHFEEDLNEAVVLIKKGIFPRCTPTEWCCTPKFCGYYQECQGPK
jgi:hypothetical protein